MNMWSSGRRVLLDLLSQPAARSLSLTPAQMVASVSVKNISWSTGDIAVLLSNTVVVERWWQVPLSKVGSPPRLYPPRHRVYKLVEDSKHTPTKKMELILTQTVPKLGGRGDTVFVKKSVGRNKLLPQGLAVYPSQENKQIFAEELRLLREGKPEERIQTRTGQLTVAFLQGSKLRIKKMPPDDFLVTKEVVRRQLLKRLGVVAPPNALSFPFESVKDVGDYWCEVTVNGIDTVRIPVSIVPFEEQNSKSEMEQQAVTDISEAAEEEKDALNAASVTAVEAEVGKDSMSQVTEASASAGASAAEGTAANTPTSDHTTPSPSDGPKKD